MVIRGGTRKLAYLRERPYANVVARVGWQWAAAEGAADLIGPDDPVPGIDAERLRLLLREIFTAAGGTHEDFEDVFTVIEAALPGLHDWVDEQLACRGNRELDRR